MSEKRTMEDIVHPITGKVLVHRMGHVDGAQLERLHREYGIESFWISIDGQEYVINLAMREAIDLSASGINLALRCLHRMNYPKVRNKL